MLDQTEVRDAIGDGAGVLRRLKIHPGDLYAFGGNECFAESNKMKPKPGRAVTIKDAEAYGIIVVQGMGKFGRRDLVTASMIRFGDMTRDELLVTAAPRDPAFEPSTRAIPTCSSSLSISVPTIPTRNLCVTKSEHNYEHSEPA